jgi:uncharacterized protein YjbJ (UPF0337 family)
LTGAIAWPISELSNNAKETAMNKDQVRGKVENLKGRGKEAAGAITGNKDTQAEGTVERIKGAVREKVGQIKSDAARKSDSSSIDDEDLDE